MKKLLTPFICLLIILSNQLAFAQDEKRGITKTEFLTVKSLTVNNLEKDTYIKTEKGFILDRYESRPAYKFNFSDGIERRIYLYKVFEADKMKEIAMLAFFVTPKDGKILKLCIPNTMAEKEIWGLYIDDLKDNDKKISGFSICVAFVLSREFSGGGKDGEKSSGEDYEYCFPAEAKIRMADFSEKSIENMKIGEKVLVYNPTTYVSETATVTNLQVHINKDFDLTGIVLFPLENETVSLTGYTENTVIEATVNHPVYTEAGKKNIGDLQTGDILYVFENQAVKKYQVSAVFAKNRKVRRVYNLVTDKGVYLVNNIVVFGK